MNNNQEIERFEHEKHRSVAVSEWGAPMDASGTERRHRVKKFSFSRFNNAFRTVVFKRIHSYKRQLNKIKLSII